MSKRTDTCIEDVGEMAPTTKVINVASTVLNFQKPAWIVRDMAGILFL